MLNAIPSTHVQGPNLPLQEQTNLQVAVQQVRTNNAEQLNPRYVPESASAQAYQPNQKEAVVWHRRSRRQDAEDSPRQQQRSTARQSPAQDQNLDLPAEEVAVSIQVSSSLASNPGARNVPAALRQYRKNTPRTHGEDSSADKQPRLVNIRA
ncbi:MAG: hypothetical protein H7833_16840 [Magnetococcus sp. DMHC-1]|nr:hypothetical protein [Magnetococcales bacterium]